MNAIKKKVISAHRILLVLLCLLLLSGCLLTAMIGKPGYGIDIYVPIVHKDIIEFARNALMAEDFKLIDEKDYNWKREIRFKKYIAPTSERDYRNFIYLELSYEKGQTPELMASLRIGMGNAWVGQQPQFKQEMERLTNIIISVLGSSMGEEDIKIERSVTGPPF